MRSIRSLALVLALALSFGAGSVSARSPYAALPPLPSKAPSALGDIKIDRIPGPFKCGEVEYAMGCMHYQEWRIEIQDSLALPIAWQVLWHELVHAAFKENGIEFEDATMEDKIADAIGSQRVLHMRAGFPKR